MERTCKVRALKRHGDRWSVVIRARTVARSVPSEIARAAEDPEKYNLIMNAISERLQMRDENWRLCYKALLLVEYMVKHGPWVRVFDREGQGLELWP